MPNYLSYSKLAVTRLLCILLTTCLFARVTYAAGYAPLKYLPEGTRSSLIVKSLDSPKQLPLASNGEFFPPASTLKLFTALAAKLELGDDFHFRTALTTNGKDLTIAFSGDPTLTHQDLYRLLLAAKKSGLKNIKGDLWLDNSHFSGYDRAVGWPWDILGVCYSAPASAITLDENCVQASIYTKNNGATRVFVPQQFPIYVTTSVKTVTKQQQKAQHCDLELLTQKQNQYHLQGCLVERDSPLPLKFAIQNTGLYASRIIYTQLRKLNISLQGSIRIGTPPKGKQTLIASHDSQKLPQLLNVMLKKSDNLIADNLTKTLGARFYLQPGTFANGTEAIRQILFAHTGIDLSQAQLADGSGLSRNNRISALMMARILKYIWQHDKELQLIELMPHSGQTGTLKYRTSMRKAPIQGQLIAKSGTLYGSHNMAGYGLDTQGNPSSLFVQFVADYYPPQTDADQPPVVTPITRFETAFYQDVIRFSQPIPRK